MVRVRPAWLVGAFARVSIWVPAGDLDGFFVEDRMKQPPGVPVPDYPFRVGHFLPNGRSPRLHVPALPNRPSDGARKRRTKSNSVMWVAGVGPTGQEMKAYPAPSSQTAR
jgi:hypothetical protein